MFYEKKIKIPNKIDICIKENIILIKGPLGLNSLILKNNFVNFEKNSINNYLNIFLQKPNKKLQKFINLYYSLILKKIEGVLYGFKITVFLKGVGYKASIENNFLILKLGFSHKIEIKIPNTIKILITKGTFLTFYGTDWEFLTQYVHSIKKYRLPEPYKGKGIILKNEFVLRKEGKKK
jgi:large subunit ribosomal protein L6